MGVSDCPCSILNAREEKLLDDEGCLRVRLICNHCGTVLDEELLEMPGSTVKVAEPVQREAAEGA